MRIALPYLIWGRSAISGIPVFFQALLDVMLCKSLGDTISDSTFSCTYLIAWMLLKLLDLQIVDDITVIVVE